MTALPAIGDRLHQFRIVAKAGEGGMGTVYRAEDTKLGREVALKFLTRVGPLDPEAAERLRIEARALAALRHPNIVTIHDLEDVDGAPFLVLEWVEGTTLDRRAAAGPLDEGEFVKVALPIAEALAAAHSRGIVHRDVKPANVLLSEDGYVKLLDFGLSRIRDREDRLTGPDVVQGTAAYMSPEQATGGEVGPPSDVFSFGMLAYELLAGRPPFAGPSVPALLYAIVNTPHVPLATERPGLSPPLTAVIERCLRKAPAERFPNAGELADAILRAARERDAHATRPMAGAAVHHHGAGVPEIRYCTTADGVSVAYAVSGSGPPIVRVLGWFTHLELEWEWPAMRLVWERLGDSRTVVRYDGRGVGLSGPWKEPYSEDTRQTDLTAVLDALGAEKVILYGISEGGWTAAHFAARHPERVSHLILFGGYSRGASTHPDFDLEERQALWTLMRKGWGKDTPEYRQIFTTAYFGENSDPGLIAHFNRLQRAATDGDTAVRYSQSLTLRGDCRDVIATIRVPTLVIHTREDKIVDFEEGKRMAALIPGARFLPLPSRMHYFPVDDDVTRTLAAEIVRFTSV